MLPDRIGRGALPKEGKRHGFKLELTAYARTLECSQAPKPNRNQPTQTDWPTTTG